MRGCPRCGAERLTVEASHVLEVSFRHHDKGVAILAQEDPLTWTDASWAECRACEWSGPLRDALRARIINMAQSTRQQQERKTA